VTSLPSPKLKTFAGYLYSAIVPFKYPNMPEIIDCGKGLNKRTFLDCLFEPVGK